MMEDKSHETGIDAILMAILIVFLIVEIILSILFKLWAVTIP